jgi:hypothetical protein
MGIVQNIPVPAVQMDQGVFCVVMYVGVTTMVNANQREEKLFQIVLIVGGTFSHVIAITVRQIQMQIVGR